MLSTHPNGTIHKRIPRRPSPRGIIPPEAWELEEFRSFYAQNFGINRNLPNIRNIAGELTYDSNLKTNLGRYAY